MPLPVISDTPSHKVIHKNTRVDFNNKKCFVALKTMKKSLKIRT